jgi:N-acetylglucosaminyl-diphospho-decaprenol L-rhamnosyltransferase
VTTLSIVILSWNTRELLEACLASLYSVERALDYEVVVVDNASEDGSAECVEEAFPQARLIRNDRNEGYARGNNIGIRQSSGAYVLLLNSDTEVRGQALETMVDFLRTHPDYGGCGARLINPDDSVQRACMRFPDLKVTLFFDTFLEKVFPENPVVRRYFMRDFDHLQSVDVDQPPGACFMVTREVVEKVGLLDEGMFLFYNDVDYCKRIWQAGYKIRFLAEAKVMHHQGASTSKYRDFGIEWHRNRVRYYRKHFGWRGVMAAKGAALLKGLEEMLKCFRAGKGLRSPEVRGIRDVVREIMKT